LALKRVQGTGLPEKGTNDEVMSKLLTKAVSGLENLLVVISKTTF
jgi:hypothetical protein